MSESGVRREAYELNEPPVMGGPVGAEQGPVLLPAQKNIIVDAVKPADTVDGAVLVRAYEAMGMGTDASFAPAETVKRIAEVDMLEENGRSLALRDGRLEVRFGPFEIKSFLLYL